MICDFADIISKYTIYSNIEAIKKEIQKNKCCLFPNTRIEIANFHSEDPICNSKFEQSGLSKALSSIIPRVRNFLSSNTRMTRVNTAVT